MILFIEIKRNVIYTLEFDLLICQFQNLFFFICSILGLINNAGIINNIHNATYYV